MKKYAKIILPLLVATLAFLLYTYVLFDDEPFDDIRAHTIVSARILTEEGYTNISNTNQIADMLDDLELKRRCYIPDKARQKGSVTMELALTDGKTVTFTVDNSYIKTEKGTFLAECEENAEFLRQAFRLLLLGTENSEKFYIENVNTLVAMAVDGKSEQEINEYAKNYLITNGLAEDILKSFANQGYSPTYIYALSYTDRKAMITDFIDNMAETESKLLVEKIWLEYKEGNLVYGFPYREPPKDFIFGDLFTDISDWDNMNFQQNEYYSYVTIPSKDNKYTMTIFIDKASYTYAVDELNYTSPKFRYTTFSFGPEADMPADYPPVDVIKNNNALETANVLTERLTFCMDIDSTPQNPVFGKTMFLITINNVDNTDFCYYNIFPLMPDRVSKQFKTTNMEKVIRQVFGDYKWDGKKDFSSSSPFNENSQSYEFSTDFGWGVMFYSAKNVSSSFSADGKQVYSTFELNGPDKSITSDPAHKSYGNYRAVYDVVTENNETFLRFNKYQKI